MGEKSSALRVVLDTNTVISALLFPGGRLGWMRQAWTDGDMLPLVSADTVRELIRVLAYPKFRLGHDDIEAVLSAYLPFTEAVAVEGVPSSQAKCSDPDDQMFVELAAAGRAEVVVSGDGALHDMVEQVSFAIEHAAAFKTRFEHK